jgi:aubergine-like protein
VTINKTEQPVLISIHEKTGQEIVLIPELCEMTGLTDAHRSNFNLMKDMSVILHKSATDRASEVNALIKGLKSQE